MNSAIGQKSACSAACNALKTLPVFGFGSVTIRTSNVQVMNLSAVGIKVSNPQPDATSIHLDWYVPITISPVLPVQRLPTHRSQVVSLLRSHQQQYPEQRGCSAKPQLAVATAARIQRISVCLSSDRLGTSANSWSRSSSNADTMLLPSHASRRALRERWARRIPLRWGR